VRQRLSQVAKHSAMGNHTSPLPSFLEAYSLVDRRCPGGDGTVPVTFPVRFV